MSKSTSPQQREAEVADLLTREQWHLLVSQYVQPEREPIVRRRERRYHVSTGLAQIVFNFVEVPGTTPVPVLRSATLAQISRGGLMVRTANPVPIDTPIGLSIQFNGAEFSLCGRVAHCTQTVAGYKIGVELLFP